MPIDPIHPPIEPLRSLLRRLEDASIEAALGGSGLLHALGLVERVNDWDLTTDAAPDLVRAALEGLPWEDRTGGQGYETAGRFVIQAGEHEIDLICRFAIAGEQGVCRLPTIVTGHWQGLPQGSLEVWAAAYWIMERTPKAELALGHLRRTGADPARLARMLQEPLPAPLRTALEGLRR